MTNPIADTLRAAKALIDTPEKWTKGALARGIRSRPVNVDSTRAICWCVRGAIDKVTGDFATKQAVANYLFNVVGRSILGWNDAPERTHAEVMDAFDRAIAAAEAE